VRDGFPCGNAACATRTISSGPGWIGVDWSDITRPRSDELLRARCVIVLQIKSLRSYCRCANSIRSFSRHLATHCVARGNFLALNISP
jgi:hypothetical protein